MNWKPVFAAVLLVAPVAIAPANAAGPSVGQVDRVAGAMEFLAALGRLDFDSAGGFLDDEAVLDLPFAGKGLTVKGREGVLQFFRKTMAGSVTAIEYRLDHAYPSRGADAIVLELSTQGRTTAGQDYRNRLVAIFEFRGSKIMLFREYFNPVPLGR